MHADQDTVSDVLQSVVTQQWNETSAAAFEKLLHDAPTGKSLAAVASSFSELPGSLQSICLQRVGALVDVFTTEGPGFDFTALSTLHFSLLAHLTNEHFLRKCDAVEASQWTHKFFPTCFECCGAALQLLSDGYNNVGGLIRMVDMCLLVLRAGFDYFETHRHDMGALVEILSPLVVDTLDQLAALSIPSAVETSALRALKTCLLLMEKVALEDNCGRMVESLLAIAIRAHSVDKEQRDESEPVLVARFTENALFDVQVREEDMPVVSGKLIDLFEQLLVPVGDRPTLQLSTALSALRRLLLCSNISEMIRTPLLALEQAAKRQVKTTSEGDLTESIGGKHSEAVASILARLDIDDTRSDHADFTIDNRIEAPKANQDAATTVDVPQWFDGSSDDDDERVLEWESRDDTNDMSREAKGVVRSVPQWFDEEEEEGAEENMSPSPQSTSNASDLVDSDGSTATEIISWSDCSPN